MSAASVAGIYPQELVSRRTLGDGRTILIRPIRPDDADRVKRFIASMTGESLYLRFHKWVAAPSQRLVHFLTNVDYSAHMALVCVVEGPDGEELVGEARYVRNPGADSCEFGIMIAEAWRKTGIAGLLMDALIRAARDHGLKSMEGLVLRSNATMLRFTRALGFQAHPIPEDATELRVVKKL